MRRLVFLLVLVPALARAQMPDPRQMSGHPRPDQQVAAGVVTVKVLRGDIGSFAPVGTPVHLVGMAAGGKVTLKTVPVNAEGRAEFKDLATDGSVVYYALAIFDGDRLVSDPISPPPRVGIRMLLSSRKLDEQKNPIGPPIDDEKSEEGKAPPAGAVELLVQGPEAIPRATLVELGAGTSVEQPVDAKTHTANFSGVAGGPDKVYVLKVGAGLRSYVTVPFMMNDAAGVRRNMVAYEKLLLAMQGGAQSDEENLAFEMQLVLANLTGAPYDTGPDGVILPLPVGFERAQIKGDDPGARMSIVGGEGVRLVGPVAPGQKEIVVQFVLPIREGRASFDMAAPLGIFQSSLFILKTARMVVSPGTGLATAPRIERADDGREYYQLADVQVRQGEHLRFEVAGLPIAPRWPFFARSAVGLVVVLIIVLALAYALRPARTAPRTPATRDGERRELVAQRERLYAELVSLERARAARRIDPDVFANQRRGIMTRLVLVHRQLDDLDAPAGGERTAAGQS